MDLDVNTEVKGGHAITAGAKLVRNEANTTYADFIDGATLDLNASWKLSAKSRLLITLDNLLQKTNRRIDDYLEASGVLRLSTSSADYTRFAIRFETTL